MDRVAVFEVVEPGILTMVQDLGRYGYSQFGVPPSGASDPFSLRVANLLVGNEEGEACLETAIMGLKLRAIRETIIAITGGDLSPTLNGESMEMWRSHLVIEGDVIGFPRVEQVVEPMLPFAKGSPSQPSWVADRPIFPANLEVLRDGS